MPSSLLSVTITQVLRLMDDGEHSLTTATWFINHPFRCRVLVGNIHRIWVCTADDPLKPRPIGVISQKE